MEPSQLEINELRKTVLEKISNAGENAIHPKDLKRIKEEDDWLRRFLLHTELKQTEALQMLWTTLQWRKEYGTNEINEHTVRMDVLILGGFFPRGKDIDDCTLLYSNVKSM
ncbi:hypothetical protein HHI36_018635 [Cryptolaemus montrouzieri]|uniref:CRAL/TRIO N-terminal domain-containing protein n=1 Tax=Cryptolaemus montrouzieri TaxID=559131 RepID=A0ABD2P0Q6_9CUCU